MDFITSLVPLIVGSVFLALGSNFLLHFYKFRKIGHRIYGRVVAIEKYTSETRSTSGHRTRNVFFRPVVEYVHNGQTYEMVGAGVNEVHHKLEQTVPVLIHSTSDGEHHQTMLADNNRVFIGTLLAVMGLCSLGVYLFTLKGSLIAVIIIPAILCSVGYKISSLILAFKMTGAQSTPHTRQPESTYITTQADYRREVSSHGFWGGVIAVGFMIFSLAIIYAGYHDMPQKAKTLIHADFGAFWAEITDGDIPSAWETPLLLSGIGLFFFLASLRSVYYVRTKYGALLRR